MNRALVVSFLWLGLPGVVAAQTPFTAAASPNPVTVQTGGGSVGVTVTTTPIAAFREPIVYSFSGFPAGIATGGSRTAAFPYDPVVFPFSATSGMAIGTYTGTLTGTSSAGTISVPMTVIVQRPDFALSAAPAALNLVPGEAGTVNVSVAGTGGFTGTVNVAAGVSPAVWVQPATFTLAPGASRAVTITALGSTGPGALSVVFTGTAPGVEGARTATVGVTIRPPSPEIDGITPAGLVAGTRDNVLRLSGRHFHPDAVITSASPGVQVVRSRVVSPGAAEVVVAVRPDASPGPYRLDLRNPDGAVAARGTTVAVHPAGSLAGPLAVTGIRIVAPRPWQVVAEDEPFHAHALLATSGMGTVVGTWVLDGVPFERFTRVVSSGHPVEIRSTRPLPMSYTGEHRLELVLESPRNLPPEQVSFLQAPDRRSALRLLVPGPDGAVDPERPALRWSLVPGASGYEVEVAYRARGEAEPARWTVVRRRVTEAGWRPEPALLERLREAETRVRVRAAFPGEVFGEPTAWQTLRFDGGGSDPDPPGGPAPPGRPDDPPGPWGDPEPPPGRADGPTTLPAAATPDPGRRLDLSLGSTTTATGADHPGPSGLTRLQVSTQTDLRGHRFDRQLSGDLSFSHDLGDPWRGRGESHSWIARFDLPHGEVRPAMTVGFAPPSFLDQTELLGVFGQDGGLQGTLASVAGRVSYYRSATLAANDGPGLPEPDIGAAAYELFTPDGRFLFRASTLHVTERAVDDFAPGGDGRALGFLASAELGPRLRVLAEAAFGEYRPGEDGFETARDGRAYRLSAQGAAGTLGYALTVGRTDAGFVNPANRGFTPGGLSGRTRANLTLTKPLFGRAHISGTYSHVRGGIGEGLGDPRTRENGASLSLALPLSSRVTVNLGGNVTGQRGEAIEELAVLETDRGQKGWDVTVGQSLGRFGLTQTVRWQDFSDRSQPWADQRVLDINLGAHGSLHRLIDLSAGLSQSRIEGDPEFGSTRHGLVSIQPSLTLGRTGLRLMPRLALARTSNTVQETDFRSSQYQAAARWDAPWASVPLTLDIAADWNRSWSAFDIVRPPFERGSLLTLGLSWRADRAW